MKNKFIFPILLASILFAAAGCSGQTTAVPAQTPLNIAWIVWPGEYPHLIAQDAGIFERHGLSVNLNRYDSQTSELADLQSGKVDGGVFGLTDFLAVSANDPGNFVAVLAVDCSDGADAIVAAPSINSFADLVGKRVSANMGTQTEFFLRYALSANGLSASDVTLVDMDPEEVPAALRSGGIEAGDTWEPSLTEAINDGNHIIFSSTEAPGLLTDVLIFRKAVVDSRPEDVRAYILAWFEALDYWTANPEESAAIIASHTDLALEEIPFEGVRIFSLADNQAAFQPGSDTTSLFYTAQLNIDYLIAIGAINRPLDVNVVFNPDFLP